MEDKKLKQKIIIILDKIENENNEEKIFELCYDLKILSKENKENFEKVMMSIETHKSAISKTADLICPERNDYIWKGERFKNYCKKKGKII